MIPARMVICALLFLLAGTLAGFGQDNQEEPAGTQTIAIMTGGPDSSSLRMAADLQAVLDGESDLRVLPVAGRGPVQTLLDLLELRGIDAAIIPADTLAYVKKAELQEDSDKKLVYLAKLASEDIHVIAAPSINSLEELRGKRVNIGTASNARFVTGSLLFSLLGIDIVPTEDDLVTALADIQSGKTQAAVFVGRKPSPVIAALPGTAFKLLPIPQIHALQGIYSPDFFSGDDYPALVAAEGSVDTLSVGVVLAALDWKKGTPRYGRLRPFVAALFANAADLREGRRYADWAAANLAAEVPGWTRASVSQAWLDSEDAEAGRKQDTGEAALKIEFETFLDARGESETGGDRTSLFEEFIRWKNEGKK